MDSLVEPYDVAMLVVLVICTAFGAWKGMAWQLAALASLVVSAAVASRFSGPLAPYFSVRAPWNRALAMLVLYLATSVIIWLLFRMVKKFINRVRLKEFDRQVGALVGLAKGVLLCLVITFFAVTLSESARQRVLRSRSGYYAAVLIHRATPALPPEIREVLGGYIEQLHQKLHPDEFPEKSETTTGLPSAAETKLADSKPAAELAELSPPLYRIMPSDLLQIELLKTRLPATYRIAATDVLQIAAKGTLAGHPIDDYYLVDATGSVGLGPSYGVVPVAGMTAFEAAEVVEAHLQQTLRRATVSLQVARSGRVPRIAGTYRVEPDGTVKLPPYGAVHLAGKTATEAELATQRHLWQFLDSPTVTLRALAQGGPTGDAVARPFDRAEPNGSPSPDAGGKVQTTSNPLRID